MISKLMPFQKKAAEFIAANPGCALFLEQGTGKTWVTCGAIELLNSDQFMGLIVVPLSNIDTTWAALLKILPVTVCRTVEEFKSHKGSRLLLVHYEYVRNKVVNKLQRIPWTLVAYDESQRLKSRSSKQSRAAYKLTGTHRVLLSGTPIEQCPQDLWAQFRFALPNVWGTKWSDFKSTYLKEGGYMGHDLTFKPHMMPQFLQEIKPYIIRHTKDEVLDLPGKRIIRAPVLLLGEQKRIYDDFLTDMVSTIDGEDLFADLKITQMVRLQQACGGFVKCNDGSIKKIGNAKLRKLVVLLKKLNGPIVVFCKYLEELADVASACDDLNLRCGTIQGKNRKDRGITIRSFQSGQLDVLVCQIKTGGVGIDLFASSTIIFYSLTFSFIDYEQAVARVDRYGQQKVVKIFLLFAENTIDGEIYSTILSKKNVSQQILGDHYVKRKS